MEQRQPDSQGSGSGYARLSLRRLLAALDRIPEQYLDWMAAVLIGIGLLLRLRYGTTSHLVMDEAYQAWLSGFEWPEIWDRCLLTTQPPLLVLLLRFIGKFNDSDMALRLVSVLSGGACAWVVYRWLGLVRNRTAGLFAVVVLVFSPTLILLGAIIRPYALAMFLTSLALYAFQRSIGEGSVPWMTVHGISLWLAVLTVYSTAFMCAAMAVYAFLHFREAGFTRRLKWWWAGAQAFSLATYVYLLFNQVIRERARRQHLFTSEGSYFRNAFPQAGDNPLEFFFRGTFGQLMYVFRDPWVSGVAAALLVAGIIILVVRWRRRGQAIALAAAALMVLPFLLAWAAAYAGAYPYGNTRQPVFLAFFFAVGAGLTLDWIVRSKAWIAAPLALALVPVWWSLAPYRWDFRDPNRDRATYLKMVDFIRREIPANSVLLCEWHSGMTVLYYLRGPTPEGPGPYRVFRDGGMLSLEDVWAEVREFRERENLPDTEKIWVVNATDYYCSWCRALADGSLESPPEVRVVSFGVVATLLEIPAGYAGPTPAANKLAGSPVRDTAPQTRKDAAP